MAVCDVVHDLANGPAALTIGSIELRWRKLTGSSTEPGGSFGNDFNRLLAQRRGNFKRRLKLSNRVTRVHKDRGLLENCSRMTSVASRYLTAEAGEW